MKFSVFTSSKGRLKGYIQVSKPGLCSQNIDHYNFIGVTNDPSNLPLTILVGRLGWGRLVYLHVLTYLMFCRGFPLDITSSRFTACSHAGRQALLLGGWARSLVCLYWVTLLNYYIYVVYTDEVTIKGGSHKKCFDTRL